MSEAYTVLARRYRPQTFDDVVGQSHVGQALQNAIASDRIAHAYLFTGARGVGKTSTARIFAKALNCPNVADGRPCNDCEVCDAIGAGSDVDVLEIDGASNRGIDDVRQLRANVGIRPMRSPRKVYIVDEVHMLTKEAFNALLKTLEEPPPNVNFVFCTTEPQKVPDTILSRCQRFDFGTIDSGKITTRLTEIAAAEGKQVEPEAVGMVARRAGGSMRDSQSLFDQLLAFGGETITAADVHQLFGTAPDERMIDLIARLMDGDRAAALSMLDEALTGGVRLDALADQVVAYVRDLMVLAGGAGGAELMSVGESHRPTLQQQADAWGLRTATAALQVLSDTKLKMARTVHTRPLFELALVRLTLLEDLDGIASLIATMRTNPQALGVIAAAGRGVSRGGGSGADSKKKVPAAGVAADPRGGPLPEHVETTRQPQQADEPAAVDAHDAAASMKRALAEQRSQPVAPPPVDIDDSPEPETNGHAGNGYAGGGGNDRRDSDEPPLSEPPLSEPTVREFARRLVDTLPPGLQAQLKIARSVAFAPPALLRFVLPGDNGLARMNLTRPETRRQLVAAATQLAGYEVEIDLHFDTNQRSRVATSPQNRDSARRDNSVVDDDPFVQSILEQFGGTVVQVTAQPAAEVGADLSGYAADELAPDELAGLDDRPVDRDDLEDDDDV